MITIIQVLIILFSLFAWSRAALRLRDKSLRPGEFFFWSIIWISLILFSLSPLMLQLLSNFLGIQRATDLALYVSIILLFYLMFRVYVQVDKQGQEITKIVREISIKRSTKKRP
ncbi:MAG: hypothetical protein KatS3mg002_0198 [Candidatus Woesearchaeota archaeon]|nr:MAG: hypothetical protein KatS3mg002_0198 [Candidatus Woesearchaeota archaeon]